MVKKHMVRYPYSMSSQAKHLARLILFYVDQWVSIVAKFLLTGNANWLCIIYYMTYTNINKC